MSTTRSRDKAEARSRHESQLAGLYEEYYDRIARYASVHIGDRNDAEDLAGDVFLKALKSLDSYEERGVPMQAWLFRIAHNLVVDYLRKKNRISTVPVETIELQGGSDSDPQAMAEQSVQMQKVREAMGRLTDDQRQVIGLRFLGGLSSKEVAGIMKKSDGAVREMQRAAIVRLRGALAIEG
jgi:RNA polymerase sigma-70 factor (ECF subfamily)